MSRAASTPGVVWGIGVYDPKVLSRNDAPHLRRIYNLWKGMLRRATTGYAEYRPAYSGVTVAQEFHHFAAFAAWVIEQVGWDAESYQLDKDLLRKGNRTYSPDTCVFIPGAINNLLTSRARMRGDLPVGVAAKSSGSKFAARLNVDGKKIELGEFDNPLSAFAAYKAAKESNIKRMADLHRSGIDPQAYDALMAYQVEITD